MASAQQAVDAAIKEVSRLGKLVSGGNGKQIRSGDERDSVKATSLSWFNVHRRSIADALGDPALVEIDQQYRRLLLASDRSPSRTKTVADIKALHKSLAGMRSTKIVELGGSTLPTNTSDLPPSFSMLAADLKMQEILTRRWAECTICLAAGAPLSATVMMGGLLEGLLLARILKQSNQAAVFTAGAAPRDRAGQPKQLKDWMLKDFISVAHELGWISVSAKDVGEVLRDYRNYIHPQKEFSHGVNLSGDDATILWEVTKSISRQLLR
ncbi:MAG TPA: hypothetical protein VI685_09075 [Candidatus Angelobacter sp.]